MYNNLDIDTVIGIDPGASGGIAVYQPGRPTKTIRMPKDIRALRSFFEYYAENYKAIVFLEKLSVRPDDIRIGEDGKGNIGKLARIQQMLANYEHLKVLLETAGIPFALVHPMKWQTRLQLRGVAEDRAERKRRYKERAAELYPDVRVTLWNGDALLIMHFGRWALVNDFGWVRANIPSEIENRLF